MKTLSHLLSDTLDSFDFAKVASYMTATNWSIEDLHDGHILNHRRFVPDEHCLRSYVVRRCNQYLSLADTPCGWDGLGFSTQLVIKGKEPILTLRFTDIRPILIESHP